MDYLPELFRLFSLWEKQPGNHLGCLVLFEDQSGFLNKDGELIDWESFEEGVTIMSKLATCNAQQTRLYMRERNT